MKEKSFFWITLILGAAVVTAVAQSPAKESTAPDFAGLARKVVTQSAGIHEGDIVLISGGVRDVNLLESIAVEVRKVGAFPLVELVSERMSRRFYDEVPEKYDSQALELARKLADVVTATISVDFVENQDFLAGVPPARIAARAKANETLGKLFLDRNIRQVSLGNGLYPTAQTARQFGITREQLSTLFWNGVNVDYGRLHANAEEVKRVLESGKEVHITNPNGTDLKVRIEGRPVSVSDGVIPAEKTRGGGPSNQVWLPAGEVYLAPVPGTAEGKIVADDDFFQGKPVRGMTMTVRGGKVTSMTAKSGLEPVKAFYDASGPGKEDLSNLDFGVNPSVQAPAGGRISTFTPAGMVTVGTGNNVWAGGNNTSSFAWVGYLSNSTVKVDGKLIVENGKLTSVNPPAKVK